MRALRLTGIFAFFFFSLTGAAWAEDARAILDRAIEAHGGAARLERTKKGRLKAHIDAHMWNADYTVECEEIFDLPYRYWRTVDGKSNDQSFHHVYAITDKKGWVREGEKPARDIYVRVPPSESRHWHAVLAMLLTLRDKSVQLKSLPEEKQDGRAFSGIQVTSPHASGDFFFDKSTGFLARTQRSVQDLLGFGDTNGETIYDHYRDIQGIQYPLRFRAVAGKSFSTTVTISSIEFCDKIDESVFLKPPAPAQAPEPRNWILIVATLGTGIVIGALWFIVRASKRGHRQTPPG